MKLFDIDQLRSYFVSKDRNNAVKGDINPSADVTYDLGTPTKRWENIYAETITATTIGGTIGGQNWDFAGSSMSIRPTYASGDSTVYITNPDGTYKADLNVEGNIIVGGNVDGVDISAHAANADAHHARSHAITSASDHTVTGAAMDLVGLTATNTLGIITPSSNTGATSKVLKTDTAGKVQVQFAGVGIDPVTLSAALSVYDSRDNPTSYPYMAGIASLVRRSNSNQGGGQYLYGITSAPEAYASTGGSTIAGVYGLTVSPKIDAISPYTNTVTNVIGIGISALSLTGTGTIAISYSYGLYVGNIGGSGVTEAYGVKIEEPSGAGTNYAISTNGGKIVFNEMGVAEADVRMEGDTNANLFFLDTSADRIGIGTNAPQGTFHVAGNLVVNGTPNYSERIYIWDEATTPAGYFNRMSFVSRYYPSADSTGTKEFVVFSHTLPAGVTYNIAGQYNAFSFNSNLYGQAGYTIASFQNYTNTLTHSNVGITSEMFNFRMYTQNTGSGNVGTQYGISSTMLQHDNTTCTVTTSYAGYFTTNIISTGVSNIGTGFGLWVGYYRSGGSLGTITNAYGIVIDMNMYGTNTNIALQTNDGNVYLNVDANADSDFRISSDNIVSFMFVDAGNERLGVNTGAPDSLVHIVGKSNSETTLAVQAYSSSQTAYLQTWRYSTTEHAAMTWKGYIRLGQSAVVDNPAGTVLYVKKIFGVSDVTETIYGTNLVASFNLGASNMSQIAIGGSFTVLTQSAMSGNFTGTYYIGGVFGVQHSSTGTMTDIIGGKFWVLGNEVSNAYSILVSDSSVASGKVWNTWHGIDIWPPGGSGTITTTAIGLEIHDINKGATSIALRTYKGLIIFNEGADTDTDVRIEGLNDQNLFFTDASANRIGINTNAPSAKLHIVGAAPQLRIGYDTNNYVQGDVGSSGTLTVTTATNAGGGNLDLNPVGNVNLSPTGNYVQPGTNYQVNLGAINKKWLTIHAGELWVDTLVARDVISTIGGEIWTAPTTELIADVGTGDTTIDVKHNQMQSGDTILMKKSGKLEAMSITSSPTSVSGGYRYSVTRNLDGTGANSWDKGDAIVNTGTTGSGFIDQYSMESINGYRFDNIYVDDGGVFSANLTDSYNFEVFPTTAVVNDALYIGRTATWNHVFFYITAGTTTATFAYEYWNGSTWTAMTTTNTPNWGSTGQQDLLFSGSAQSGWATTAVNSVTQYWIRIRVATVTSWTTSPKQVNRRIRGNAAQFGPTIVGFVRDTSPPPDSSWNRWSERWVVGNMNGYYGYGSDTYGFATGTYASAKVWMAMDEAGGFRVNLGGSGFTTLGQWNTSGEVYIGATATEHIKITNTTFQIKYGATVYTEMDAGIVKIGDYANANGEYVVVSATNGIQMYANGSETVSLTNMGVLRLGLSNDDRVVIDPVNGIEMYIGASTRYIYINPSTPSVTIGNTSDSHMILDPNNLVLKDTGGIVRVNVSATNILMGDSTSAASFYTDITASSLVFYERVASSPLTRLTVDTNGLYIRGDDGTNVMTEITAAQIIIGDDVTGGDYIKVSSSGIELFGDAAASPIANITISTSGVVTIGQAGDDRVVISSSGGIEMYSGSTQVLDIATSMSTGIWLGASGTTERLAYDTTNGLRIFNHAGSAVISMPTSGNATVSGTLQVTGALVVGSSSPYDVTINTSGITINSGTGNVNKLKWYDTDVSEYLVNSWAELLTAHATNDQVQYWTYVDTSTKRTHGEMHLGVWANPASSTIYDAFVSMYGYYSVSEGHSSIINLGATYVNALRNMNVGYGLAVGNTSQAPPDNDVVIEGGLSVGDIAYNPATDTMHVRGTGSSTGLYAGASSDVQLYRDDSIVAWHTPDTVIIDGDLYTTNMTDYLPTINASNLYGGLTGDPTGYVYYKVIGKMCFVWFSLSGTTVLNTLVYIQLPYSMYDLGTGSIQKIVNTAIGGTNYSYACWIADANKNRLYFGTLAGANFGASQSFFAEGMIFFNIT